MLNTTANFERFSDSQSQGAVKNLALHTLGWKAFQDLCSQLCEESLGIPVSIFREAQDGGQDAVFLITGNVGTPSGVGTVQCKFTSKQERRLKVSDIGPEKETISKLISDGRAHTYYFMTNMGVDAPVAAEIVEELVALGVKHVQVFGLEWITLQIRNSSRLRALVPRVYGLGDLSIILDERRVEQTRSLLGHLMIGLDAYVPTASHRHAVRTLAQHGIVLLLGAPATGKSMLAAILSTTALDGDGHACFQLDGPQELSTYWNPNERNRLYWIDDAFGPNQLRGDYVDTWIAIMPKVKAALAAGNRFVLTSRRHIWMAATSKLGTRNHPLLANAQAIVDVGALSPNERAQILYNHVKSGNQPIEWKRGVKKFLPLLAADTNLLPEIARRLGDSSYTSGIKNMPSDLQRFVANPMEFLKDTLNELTSSQRAALTLVFLYRSRLAAASVGTGQWATVADKFSVSATDISEALEQLVGSFIKQRSDVEEVTWSFIHPTIADALASILARRPDLVELYVRGSRIGALLTESVCDGAPPLRDAVVIPRSVTELLIERLGEVPDEPGLNRSLVEFFIERCSEEAMRLIASLRPELLSRNPGWYWRIANDPRTRLNARLHSLGLLSANQRSESA